MATLKTLTSAESSDPWIEHAKDIIFADYGVRVSLEAKNKDLLRYGRNRDMETAIATLMTLPDGIDNESYVSTNIITHIVSTSVGDTTTISIEGHTVVANVFTFVFQTVTLNGQTEVALATPLARVTNMFADGSVDLVGTVSIYRGGASAGVPTTPSEVHLQIFAGKNQSEKASTTLSSVDYWVITKFYADMLTKASAFAEVDLEIRLAGKVFREVADISCSDSHAGEFNFKPYLIVPPNSDIRLRGTSDASGGRDVSGGIMGALLKA